MAKIAAEAVTKSFGVDNSVLALAGVNLTIGAGEFVSVVGPSGCGKSTFLYMLGGFMFPSSGKLLVDGKPVVRPGVDRGIVFQEYALFPWLTVFENIAYGLRMARTPEKQLKETVQRYIKLIGLSGFEDRFPRELSGGMKQRVALARTFVYGPDVLLLDEPFGALDSQTRETMQDELLRLWQSSGKTVLMVTHDVNEAVYLSDRVLVMSKRPGRIVSEFKIDLDRSVGRERVVLSDNYTAYRNEIWLAVRHEAVGVEQEAAQ